MCVCMCVSYSAACSVRVHACLIACLNSHVCTYTFMFNCMCVRALQIAYACMDVRV